ncbi:MAG: class I tRNA ligase family protein [Chloroflexota bacterium]
MTEPTASLAKAYAPAEFEHEIYERWIAADVFAPDGAGSRADWAKDTFTIIQPPPNVTGSLHLGHAQRTTVEDLMIRHARMGRRPALYLPGLDHASIAAQFVLDKILAGEGESRASLGRERYLERMRGFVEDTRSVILTQQRRVGGSCDWGRLRFTMDEVSSKAVREAFLRLYRKDLAYRAEALINWCPGCRTSVSDLEVIPTPETGSIWRIRCSVIDEATGQPSAQTVTVATTRPETLLGDTAVAVHPEDPRYTRARRPARADPVRGPRRADHRGRRGGPEVRHGRRQDAPAHDHETTRRASATTRDADGARRQRARGQHRHALRRPGALQGAQRDPRGPRHHGASRARRPTRWSSAALPAQQRRRRAAPEDPVVRARGAARRRRARGHALGAGPPSSPERFEKVWEHWMTTIRDWNVSRQLWWGHRIPAWYCPDGHATVSAELDGPSMRGLQGRRRAPPARTPTSSTRGSARGCGRSPRSAGRTTPKTCAASIRARSWRPASRASSSSGSPG